jgi:hypothetical protein
VFLTSFSYHRQGLQPGCNQITYESVSIARSSQDRQGRGTKCAEERRVVRIGRQNASCRDFSCRQQAPRLFRHRRRLQSSAEDPLQNCAILPALFIAVPPLPAVVRGEVITNIPHSIGWPRWLDQHQTLGGVVDVYYVHGVLIVVFAVLVGEDALIVAWAQFEDHMYPSEQTHG